MDAFLTPAEWTALAVSIRIAAAATLAIAIPGTACGWWLARRDFRGKALVETLVHAPLVLPPVVTGYLLLVAFGRAGPVGRRLDDVFGIDLSFTAAGAALAAGVVAFPLLVRAVRLGVELIDQGLEDAAATLGAGPWKRFATITLPLAAPGVITGMLLAFARALGEFGATITFAGNIPGLTRTLPLAIYSGLEVPGGEAGVARLVLISIGVSLLALLASETLARRMRARMGR